jgi:glycosyltransferase involved in cell wall biosynthesis
VLSHHWLVRHRGGERVLRCLREMYPLAPVYTFVHDPDYTSGKDFRLGPDDRAEVHASLLQELPGAIHHYPKLLPLMPLAARLHRLPPAELVICSDAALAKAFPLDAETRLLCYCHSPMRYVWDLAGQYREDVPPLLRPLWPALARRLQAVDRAAAARVDLFVANSKHVAARIERHYGRPARVVYPPVAMPPEPPPTTRREDYYLCVGQHVAYKRLDLAIAACVRLGRRLVVIGEGPAAARLRAESPPGVQFLGWQPDAAIHAHYRRARGLLFPGEEDFGIVPVEAQAHGCPVIAFGVGGASETVVDGRSGVLFSRQQVEDVIVAIERAESLEFDPADLYESAARVAPLRFVAGVRAAVAAVLAGGVRD